MATHPVHTIQTRFIGTRIQISAQTEAVEGIGHKHDFRAKLLGSVSWASPFPSCVTLEKLLRLSVPDFPHVR